MGHPLFQVLHGHGLAAEQHLVYRLRHFIIQPVEGGYQTQSRHRPDHGGDFPVTQVVQQLGGLGEQGFRDDFQPCAGTDGGVNVLDGHVEVKGRLIADDVLFGDGEQLGEMTDKVDDRAVTHGHALGDTGGTGSEVGIQRVNVQCLGTDGGQRTLVFLRCHQIFQMQHLQPFHRGKLFRQTPAGDHPAGFQRFQNGLHTGCGEFGVDEHIEASGIDGAEKQL